MSIFGNIWRLDFQSSDPRSSRDLELFVICGKNNEKDLKAGVNLKFAQKLSFLFSSEFAALGIKLCYGKIIFHLFSLFLPF